jgi:hypothetical protein
MRLFNNAGDDHMKHHTVLTLNCYEPPVAKQHPVLFVDLFGGPHPYGKTQLHRVRIHICVKSHERFVIEGVHSTLMPALLYEWSTLAHPNVDTTLDSLHTLIQIIHISL